MNMKKPIVWILAVGLVLAANAGGYLVHVKMPDNTVVTFELPTIPMPDARGMVRLHNKNGGDLIVHVSNVWIVEKSNKGKGN